MSGFKMIIGHEQTKEHLQNAIKSGKVSHAYLLNGEKGSGKRTVADAFAMTLQCEQGGTEVCGTCHSCKQAESHNHPDIIYVAHEKPNSIGVDEIRDQLVNDVQIRPYNGKYKIYIVPEAEKMTVQAQNALLKTLEEPPAYAVIILLTENAQVFLDTIRSRCVLLNLKPVPDELVKQYLMEHQQIPDYQADVCVAFAQGSIGQAISLASSENFTEIKSTAIHLLRHVKEMDLNEIIAAVKSASQFKITISDYLDILAIWFRDVLYFKATRDVDGVIFKDQIKDVRSNARTSSYEGIEQILTAIQTAKTRLKANVNFDLTMELLFLTIKEN
ncbi:MAG: DNA polymerase III subunit delta' [Lachnospiraceae bacterium]|nr:DNA polymerase III subunit delta' [Lachnospiraceae bacterium]MDD3794911.1 DNA polymerase III subunit delta' [Lachnospiraceae bacterium]